MGWTVCENERQTDGPSGAQNGNPEERRDPENDQAEGGRMTL